MSWRVRGVWVLGVLLVLFLAAPPLPATGESTPRSQLVAPVRREPVRPSKRSTQTLDSESLDGYDHLIGLPSDPALATVVCAIPGAPDRGAGTGTGSVSSEGAPQPTVVLRWADRLVAKVPPGSGTGTFDFYGEMDGTFTWADAAAGTTSGCSDLVVLHERTGVYGTVLGTPLPGVYVIGCGGFGEITNNEFFMEVIAPADCSLKVVSVLADRSAQGPSTPVHSELGLDAQVVLRYPQETDYVPIPDGMRPEIP